MCGPELEMIERSRTLLFVPGDRPDRFDRALGSDADLVVLDLEDAVAADGKARARREVAAVLDGRSALVRVSAARSADHASDLAAVAGRPGLLGCVLAKTEDPDDVGVLAAVTQRPVIALVETARGVRDAAAVASASATARLALGTIDLAADLGCGLTWEALLLARSTVVLASRAAGLPPPLDGVHADLTDEPGLRASVVRASALGFGGTLVIHPDQVRPVHETLRPDDATVAWAHAVLALPDGATVLDGQMVDEPVRKRARGVLARAGGR